MNLFFAAVTVLSVYGASAGPIVSTTVVNSTSGLIGSLNKLPLKTGIQQIVTVNVVPSNENVKIVRIPPNYSLSTELGKAYLVHTDQLSWQSARNVCISEGGHLATPNSEAEDVYVQSLIKDLDKTNKYWIGFSDLYEEGNFVSIFDEPIKVRSNPIWGEGQPDNSNDEDCVEIIDNLWNDDECTVERPYICEIKI